METLELTCPFCDTVLVLDTGFAGGVCRCSNCGMLMAVPNNPTSKRPTQKSRPERPQNPNEPPQPSPKVINAHLETKRRRASVTQKPTETQPTPTSQRPHVKKRRSSTSSSRRTAKPAQPPAATVPSSTTSTGPVSPEPTGKRGRRRGKTWTVRVAVVTLLLLLLGTGIFAAVTIVRHQRQMSAASQAPPPVIVDFAYNAADNPYSLGKPNILGLPLSPQTAIVLDTSSISRSWLGLVKDAILAGTDFDTSAVAFHIVIDADDRQTIFPDSATPLTEFPREQFRQFLNGILAFGITDPVNAVRRALGTRPEQLILITGQKLPTEHVNAIRGLLKNSPNTRFDAVLIDSAAVDLLSITSLRKGQYITLTSQQLNEWRYSAR